MKLSTQNNIESAAQLIAAVQSGMSDKGYSEKGRTWVYDGANQRIDIYENATGSWSSLEGKYSRRGAVREVAERVASTISAKGEDDSLRFYVSNQFEKEDRESAA